MAMSMMLDAMQRWRYNRQAKAAGTDARIKEIDYALKRGAGEFLASSLGRFAHLASSGPSEDRP